MASSHRETRFSGKNPSKSMERGSAAATLHPCKEQVLRSHIESAAAGKKNLTDVQMAELLSSTFPEVYSHRNRERLIERVAKITPLACRREVADGDGEPTTKRQKVGENRIVRKQIEASRASASASFSDSNDREVDPDKRDELELELELDSDAQAIIDGWRWGVEGKPIYDWDLVGSKQVKLDWGDKWPMFSDFEWLKSFPGKLNKEVIAPLVHFKVVRHFGAEPATSVLLQGPSGCGKTTLARAIGNEAGVPFYETSGAALMSGVSGSGILELFCKACKKAPSILFIDEIEAMTSNMETPRSCPVKQLLACMDEPVNDDPDSDGGPGYVLVIGATNKLDALDPALRQRFDREFFVPVPDVYGRRDILPLLTRNLKMEAGFDHFLVASWTRGYVTRDLVALVKNACMVAVTRTIGKKVKEAYSKPRVEGECQLLKDSCRKPFSDEELKNLRITMRDFEEAGAKLHPSAKMECFSPTLNVKWDDVGGLQLLKLEFERRIIKPLKFPRLYEDIGVNLRHLGTIIFLYGPSGCGKTLIVEALAKEAGASYLHIKAPELLSYGDQTELVVKNIFSYARAHRPCIVFFDELELDVTIPCCTEDKYYEYKWPDYRKLLDEMVCTDLSMTGVYVIGASSRPEITTHMPFSDDDFEMTLYVPFPTPEERGEILKALGRDKPIDADVDLMALGRDVACENFSGADLSALMREAAKIAIDRPSWLCGGCMTIKDADFKSALAKVSPSLSPTEIKNWELHEEEADGYGSSVARWCSTIRY